MATYYVTTSGNNANAGTSEGAAWADLGYAVTQVASDDTIYVKSGTYTLTTSTPGAGGPIVFPSTGLLVEGYQTTIGDRAARPIISAGTITSIDVIQVTGGFGHYSVVSNIEVDAVDNTTNRAIAASGHHGAAIRCVVRNALTGLTPAATQCLATGCATGFGKPARAQQCVAMDCTTGFTSDQSIGCSGNVAIRCTNGFLTTFYNSFASCIAVECTYGFYTSSASPTTVFTNCLAASCTTAGWYTASDWSFVDCAGYNNTTDIDAPAGSMGPNIGFTSLTADPFVNAAGDDYTIDATSGSDLMSLLAPQTNATFAGFKLLSNITSGGAVLHPLRSTR